MNRTDFMRELDRSLGNISFEQKKDIMYDYEEHFTIGLQNGKTEDEIIRDLGNPASIAKQYRAECMLKNAENNASTRNVLGAVLAAMGLGFFNLIFMLGPFIAVVGVFVGLFAGAIAISVSGAAVLGASLFMPSIISFIPVSVTGNLFYTQAALFFISIGIVSLGALSTIGVWQLARLFAKLTVAYLKLNINVISRKGN